MQSRCSLQLTLPLSFEVINKNTGFQIGSTSIKSAEKLILKVERPDKFTWRAFLLVYPPTVHVLQVIVQSGRQPSVLQKLCQLPFQYFSHPRLIRVLFPSLISACYNNGPNKVILQQEMSCVLLATFIQVKFVAS